MEREIVGFGDWNQDGLDWCRNDFDDDLGLG